MTECNTPEFKEFDGARFGVIFFDAYVVNLHNAV